MNPYRECKPGCCKTGRADTCYHRLQCPCHTVNDKIQQARDAWQDYIDQFLQDEHSTYQLARPSTCHDCRRTLRTRKQPATPGSALHQAHGYCTACYEHHRKRDRARNKETTR